MGIPWILRLTRRSQKPSSPLTRKAFGCLIPEPEMEFDGERHFRIVIVAVGTPARHPYHRRQVIDGDFSLLAERLITERPDRLERTLDRLRRAVQVQVVLGAVAQIITVAGPLCESFENDEIDAL